MDLRWSFRRWRSVFISCAFGLAPLAVAAAEEPFEFGPIDDPTVAAQLAQADWHQEWGEWYTSVAEWFSWTGDPGSAEGYHAGAAFQNWLSQELLNNLLHVYDPELNPVIPDDPPIEDSDPEPADPEPVDPEGICEPEGTSVDETCDPIMDAESAEPCELSGPDEVLKELPESDSDYAASDSIDDGGVARPDLPA